ncbi:MAG: hypothetical protein OXU23_25570 [Candidatus Poribacteria bacterium]|nr:hypothetical protein [Candidatus Poribacteria bacterium]
MSINFGAGEIIACLALILSGYATWRTGRFNEKQKSLIESQKELTNLLLEKEKGDVLGDKKADLSATFVKLGSSKHRLKIWNKGNATARNVKLEFPEGNDVLIQSEINEKFPLESLEKYQSVELIAAVHLDTRRKHVVRLIWEDDAQKYNEKIAYPTL